MDGITMQHLHNNLYPLMRSYYFSYFYTAQISRLSLRLNPLQNFCIPNGTLNVFCMSFGKKKDYSAFWTHHKITNVTTWGESVMQYILV